MTPDRPGRQDLPVSDPAATTPARRRGKLRIYLGAAPGVGKTFAMLSEGRRRRDRGTDVVVGFVETHGRQRTAEQIGDLEIVPRRTSTHRDTTFEEMDLETILRRAPEQVLVDELAHTNVPGSTHAKRWQDIDDLLDAGIDVISTVNIQHLDSLNDVVERITGIQQRETVPDHVVRAAHQIELVDMDPDALRRRLAHGNVYAADKVDAALGNYFRPGNLAALRELALLWVADRVDDALATYREGHGITAPWETRERVVVAVSGAPAGRHLLRRAARIAQRAHGDLVGVHVVTDSGLSSSASNDDVELRAQRQLLEALGGTYRKGTGNDVATALVDVARADNATQIVLGSTGRSRWHELINGSIVNRVVRRSGPIDVHVISRQADAEDEAVRLPAVRRVLTPLSPRRQAWGWLLAAAGLPLVTLVLAQLRSTFELASVLLLYLALAMVVALVGGALPAGVAVVGGLLLANWFFIPPLYGLEIGDAENVLALAIYTAAAGIVAVLVDRVGRSRMRAARAQAEAEALASLAGSISASGEMHELLDQVCATFGFRSAALLRKDGAAWTTTAMAGEQPPATPDEADAGQELGNGFALVLAGGTLSAGDERVLDAFASQVAGVAERDRLQAEAGKAGELEAANTLRAALLQAVSHDLRTPLAAIKASISSLRQTDVSWSVADVADFQETIEQETDRLTTLVTNLLDMSRLQATALTVLLRPTGVEETVLAAVASLGARAGDVELDLPETLPEVVADGALLERALANLIANAARVSPPGRPPRVTAGAVRTEGVDRIDVRVIDRGPGIPPSGRASVFQPFQRLVDHQHDGSGVGLGLAIARGFVDAMGGQLTIDDTAGGGTTMVVELPVANVGARRQPASARLRRPARRDGRAGPAARRPTPPRRRAARPRPPRHGRHRRDRRVARLDERADRGALGTRCRARQGRRARCGRRRLRVQAVRHGRAARPAAGGSAQGDAGRAGAGRHDRALHDRSRRQAGARRRRRTDPPDSHRVAAARGARPPPRQARRPAPAATGGVGSGVRRGEQLPARPHRGPAAQARARARQAALPHHRAGHGLPIRQPGLSRMRPWQTMATARRSSPH